MSLRDHFPEPVWTKDDIHAFLDRHFSEARKFGTEILLIEPGFLRARLPYNARHLRPGGTISGPTQMTLVDTVFYYLLLAHLGDEALAVTTSLNINFMRRPAQAALIAETRLLKLGRSLCVGDATLFSEGDERPVAHAQLTYSIPPKRIEVEPVLIG
jgi:uncharacterized protein (TIGR00369 family)